MTSVKSPYKPSITKDEAIKLIYDHLYSDKGKSGANKLIRQRIRQAQKDGHFIRRADLELGKAVPMKGDVVVYWFASKGRLAHAGIVVDGGKTFYTVEGNTSSGIETSVDRDGQGTYKKLRKYSHLGNFGGIIRLPY